MERIVVVGVIPAQRPRRNVAVLVGLGDVRDRLDRGFLDLRIVKMDLAVLGDDAVASIGLKKSQNASHVFGASDNLNPAFSTSEFQTWKGTTAVLYGTM